MPVNKNRITNSVKNNDKNNLAGRVENVNMELLLTLNETSVAMQQKKCQEVVPYILWNDFVNKQGTLATKSTRRYNRYTWGAKVFVDFGMTNIQTEISYPHPAIILYNFSNTVIVVPTTSDDKLTAFSSDIEEAIIKVKGDGNVFPHDSIINLHQVCAIHKERILSDLGCNVKSYIMNNAEIDRLNGYGKCRYFQYNSTLLDCIRTKLLHLFGDDYLDTFYENEAYYLNEIYDLKKRIVDLEQQIENNKEQPKEEALEEAKIHKK